jgi:hypothetical protein
MDLDQIVKRVAPWAAAAKFEEDTVEVVLLEPN